MDDEANPIKWRYDRYTRRWIGQSPIGTYHIVWSGAGIVVMFGGQRIATVDNEVAALDRARTDYASRAEKARRAEPTSIDAAHLIEAMIAAIDVAYANLAPGVAPIAVAAALEAVAEAVGIDPEALRSETRP